MKNIKIICLLLVMVLVFCSCGKTPDNPDVPDNPDNPVVDPIDDPDKEDDKNKVQYEIPEFVSKLSKDEYADSSLTDDGKYGLSDVSNVGVVKEEMSKELYPINASNATTIDVTSFTGDGFDILTEAFAEAKRLNGEGKKAVIVLPKDGELVIDSSKSTDGTFSFVLDDYDGLYIQGNGCKLTITYPGIGYKGALYFRNSKDVHINDIVIDYAVPTFVTGTINNYDQQKREITVDVFPEFNETMKRFGDAEGSGRAWSYLEFNGITKAPLEDGNFCTPNENQMTGKYSVTGDEDNGYKLAVKFDSSYEIKENGVGHLANVAFSMYAYNAISFSGGENEYIEGVTIHTCPGMGITASQTTNIYVNRLNITLPKNSSRIMTCTADGLHFGECFGEIIITNSIIENTHDDALNVKSGYWYSVKDVNTSDKTIVIMKKTSAITMPDVGNQIAIYDQNSFELKGTVTVSEVSGDGSTYTIKTKESLRPLGASSWAIGCIATNISKCAKFTFNNNIVRNKRNRGLLLQTRDIEIKNNTFENVGHGSISIHSSLDQFNEATLPDDVLIENNKFMNNGYLTAMVGDIYVHATATIAGPVGTIKNLGISNNFFARSGNAAVCFSSCSDSYLKNNLFFNTGRHSLGELYMCCIYATNSGYLNIEGNYNYRTIDSESFAGIKTGGLTDTQTITLEKNVNINYEVVTGEVLRQRVAKVTSGITIDGNIDDWADLGTVVPMVGHSLATGDPLDYEEYKDVFEVKLCKIAWNDDGIMFVFDLKDDRPDFRTIQDFWSGDCFEYFATTILNLPNADFALIKEKGDTIQMAAGYPWKGGMTVWEGRTSSKICEKVDQIIAKVNKTEDGYSGEFLLPFSVFGDFKTAVEEGNEIAMAFVFADNKRDDIGRNRLQVSNCPHFVEAWKTKTAKMPLYLFVEE